jgi:4-hydroxy-tetrahydrodipicolinate reductase
VVDAGTRRWTLQHRLGVGLEPARFRDWVRQRTTPHVGLRQSLHMIADAFDWQLDQIVEHIEPIIADEWVRTPHVCAAPGQVAGIHQSAQGFVKRRPMLELEWRTAVGLGESYDAVQIEGTPPIDMLIRGGIHGDLAAATLVARAVPLVVEARTGLRTVLDLPIVHYRAQSAPPAADAIKSPAAVQAVAT